MALLKEYFVGIITLSVIISVMLAVSHNKLKGVITFGAGILIISAIMLPLVDIIKGFDVNKAFDGVLDGFDYEGKSDDAIELAFEDGVAAYISDRYGVERECIRVMADGFSLEKLQAERIYVTLSGKAALLDYKRIEKDIADEFTSGGECEVSLNIG